MAARGDSEMEREEYRNPGEMVFHYNRGDRVKSLSPEVQNRKPKGILKGNRGLIILLIDILLIIILYVVLTPLLRGPGDSVIKDGYRFSLEAFVYKQECLVRVKVEMEEDQAGKHDIPPHQLVNVLISLEDRGLSEETADLLPQEEGESRTLRSSFDLSGIEEDGPFNINAIITLGENQFVLATEAEGE
jgi:hypothetical protein